MILLFCISIYRCPYNYCVRCRGNQSCVKTNTMLTMWYVTIRAHLIWRIHNLKTGFVNALGASECLGVLDQLLSFCDHILDEVSLLEPTFLPSYIARLGTECSIISA